MQRFGHALPAGSFPIVSLVRLHNKDELEGTVQLGCPYSFSPAGDRASRLGQRYSKGACPCLWSLEWSICGARRSLYSTTLVADFEYDTCL